MATRRIYFDSCVLIAAFKAEEPEVSDAALALLDDPEIERLYSGITELEVMPKAVFNKRKQECDFYRAYFEAAIRVPCSESTITSALECGKCNGLSAGDALHIASAIAGAADELVTSEKKNRLPSAPSPGIRIRTLRRP